MAEAWLILNFMCLNLLSNIFTDLGLDILPANAPKETAESVDLSATDVTG